MKTLNFKAWRLPLYLRQPLIAGSLVELTLPAMKLQCFEDLQLCKGSSKEILWKPQSKRFPAVDFLCQPRYGFQATWSLDHPINADGMKRVVEVRPKFICR